MLEASKREPDAQSRDVARREPAPPTGMEERTHAEGARVSGDAARQEGESQENDTQRPDVVLDASDESFPASDPPSWIDVWL